MKLSMKQLFEHFKAHPEPFSERTNTGISRVRVSPSSREKRTGDRADFTGLNVCLPQGVVSCL